MTLDYDLDTFAYHPKRDPKKPKPIPPEEPPPDYPLPPKDEPKPKPPPPPPHRETVVSSNLAAVTYDFMNQTLVIEFHRGGAYRYFGVPSAVYHALMGATSKGRYFRAAIRHSYLYSRA